MRSATITRALTDHRPEVAERWSIWQEEKASRRAGDRGGGINAASLFAALSRTADADEVMCADVGKNTYSFGRYFEVTNQSVLRSGYLGSIGFGFPAAMGLGQRSVTYARSSVCRVTPASGSTRWRSRITKTEQVDSALAAALAHEGPAIVEVITDVLLV